MGLKSPAVHRVHDEAASPAVYNPGSHDHHHRIASRRLRSDRAARGTAGCQSKSYVYGYGYGYGYGVTRSELYLVKGATVSWEEGLWLSLQCFSRRR